MYITIATITDYSYSVDRSKDIKISQTLEEAKQSLIEELQYKDLTVIDELTENTGWLYYARGWDEEYDCEIEWRVTEIKLDEYYGICG